MLYRCRYKIGRSTGGAAARGHIYYTSGFLLNVQLAYLTSPFRYMFFQTQSSHQYLHSRVEDGPIFQISVVGVLVL